MLFKMTITKTQIDGTQNKIEIENGEVIHDQAALFDFLRPLVTDGEAEATRPSVLVEGGFANWNDPAQKEAPQKQPEEAVAEKDEATKIIVNRAKEPTPEKKVVRKYSGRETGVAQIHCPSCGLETAKHAEVKQNYIHCPSIKCNAKLFLFALNDVIGEPNELGVSFKANQIYKTAREKWEEKNGY